MPRFHAARIVNICLEEKLVKAYMTQVTQCQAALDYPDKNCDEY